MSDSVKTEADVEASAPNGWVWTRFDDTCEPISDGGLKVPQRAYQESGQFPIIDQGEELIGGYSDNAARLFRGKTPVIAFGDHTRRFKLINWPFVIGADGVKLIGPTAAWNAKCLWYFLRALKFEDRGYSRHFQFLRKSKLPLPPFAEQSRIADVLDELFSDLDAGVAPLVRVREKLKLYRASVLKTAVEGALTAEWRKQHPHVEPASELLKRILAERRRRWEEDQLAKFKATGQKPSENWRSKYNKPVAPETSHLPPLPEGGCWATVEQIASERTRSIQSGPFGSQLLHSEFSHEGYLAIGIDNVLDGKFSLGREHRITPEKFNRLRKFEARPRDVIVTVMATVGRVCVLPADLEPSIITKHCYRITADDRIADPEFLGMALRAESPTRQHIYGNIRGQTRPGINGLILKLAPVALLPRAEQEAIVETVEDQFSVIDHLEADLDAKLNNAATLRQAILHHAFTGQLLPQDPNDEPASELLKRIAVEREARTRVAAAKRATKKTSSDGDGRRRAVGQKEQVG